MEQPFIPTTIEVGDSVQAHHTDEGDQITTTEFTVTGIKGNVYSGASDVLGDLDTADGWHVELVRKGNPKLPRGLAYIAAISIYDRSNPTKLIGAGDSWQVDGGAHIDHTTVLAWMPWDDWAALATAYNVWHAQQVAAERALEELAP